MRVVLCTCSPSEAGKLAHSLVEERLVACVNIVPTVRSVYRWKGEVCDDEESLLVMKTRASLMDRLTERIVELHSYDVPEVISYALAEGEGNPDYLAWLVEQTA